MLKLNLHRKRRQRGAALIVALALVLCLTIVVTGTQMQVVQQIKQSKGQRDYDRALQLAEAGANAYLNYLAQGTSTSLLIPWGAHQPPVITTANIPSAAQVRSDILAGNIIMGGGTNTINGTLFANSMGFVNFPAQASLITKPAAGSQYGYFVILNATPSANVKFVSYGYANGVVRRVQVEGYSSDIFDWAAVYGMDRFSSGNTGPGLASNQNANGTDSGNAWTFTGSANVVGASGGEGFINGNNNVTYYDGPIILAANGNTLNTTDPAVSQSAPNVPTGHSGTGTLASPLVRRLARSLDIETADEAANAWAYAAFGASTTAGVEYFKTYNNNNATGVRMLVKVTNSSDPNYGRVRELPTAWAIPTTSGGGISAYELQWPGNSAITAAGKTNNETFVGLRMYPGNYYIQKWTQSTSQVMYLRTNASSTYVGVDGDGNSFPVYNSDFSSIISTNPNSGMSSEKNVRVWVGNPTSGNSPDSGFSDNTFMEDPSFASRFRLYFATKGTVTISGTNANPPKKFRVNILSKAQTPYTGTNSAWAGQNVTYGTINIASGTYLYGSLLAWQVKVAGGCTIEKQASEGTGPSGPAQDVIAYYVTNWKELP
jgi:hypothetical protein